jgi:hypothetical protein
MTYDRFAGFADHGGMPFGKADNGGIPEGFTPPKRKTQPKVRNARNVGIDDEDGFIPAEKGNTMSDTDNPFYKMIDRQALALQAQTGMSYASAFTKCYTDPTNKTIVDQVQYEHLAQQHDAMFGYRLATPVTKAAPPDPPQDDVVSPGPAHDRLAELVITRMRNEPNISHAQAFTREYLHPSNLSLKQRYDAESDAHMRRLTAGKPFPAYGNPGDVAGGGRIGHTVGTSGAKPRGYAGG